MRQATITINGRLYNALNGQPLQPSQKPASNAPPGKPQQALNDIAKTAPARPPHPHHPATAVHNKPQRSATLNRQAIQKPELAAQVAAAKPSGRSPLISRFKPAVIDPAPSQDTPNQQAPKTKASTTTQNTTPLHPSVMAAMQQRAALSQPPPQNSKQLKEMLIREKLAEVGNDQAPAKPSLFARKPKLASILVSTLSLLLLGGYFTYVNLTNISMRVAASNAGINASFPGYKPDGYNLGGPITFAPGEVAINFKSNTNNSNFTLTQKTSNWDSQGVLDNYVRKQTSTYLTFQQRGVTVYTFSNKAAWTNGGLLYTIDGDASLSSDQILRLATSL